MSANWQQAAGLLSADLLRIHGIVNQLQGGFTRLGTAIIGAFAIFIGDRIIRGLESITAKTKE